MARYSTISLTIAKSLSEARVKVHPQLQRSGEHKFCPADQSSIHHQAARLWPKRRIITAHSPYRLSQAVHSEPNEQAITAHLGLSYDFRDWVSGAVMDYTHHAAYFNQISLGMTVHTSASAYLFEGRGNQIVA
jgi:hypothetical protein